MDTKKYELINESITVDGHVLYRILALRIFGGVQAGNLGGYVESEKNLSHEDICWIFGDACVYEDANVSGDASVSGNAQVYGSSRVSGYAHVSDRAHVYGNARVSGFAWISGKSHVYEDSHVSESAWIFDMSQIYGTACVTGDTAVGGNVHIFGNAHICTSGSSNLEGYTKIDRGVWTQEIEIDYDMYLVSSTLEKILMRGENEQS